MKIKILLIAILISGTFSACTNNDKADEKKQLAEVLKVHDEVMGKSDRLVEERKRIDSLTKAEPNIPLTKEFYKTAVKLSEAETAMETWMHEFNADNTGRSHQQIMAYLKGERVKLVKVDSMMTTALAEASNKH